MILEYYYLFLFTFVFKTAIFLSNLELNKSDAFGITAVVKGKSIIHQNNRVIEIFKNNNIINENGTCAYCEERMVYIQRLIKYNSTDKAFDKMLINECMRIINNYEKCYETVNKFSKITLKLISNTNSTYACNLMFQCGDICKECKLELSNFINIINNYSVKNEFISMFNSFCSKLGPYSTRCLNNVNTQKDVVINDIIIFFEANPCEKLGVCENSTIIHQRTEHLGYKNKYGSEITPLPENTPAGMLCTAITSMLGSIFSANLVQRGVIQLFTMFCNFLPDEQAASDCQSFVLLYLGGILDLIQALVPAQALCIGLLGKQLEQIPWIVDFSNDYKANHEENYDCLLCQSVSNDLLSQDSDYTKPIMIEIAKNICINFEIYQEECKTFFIDTTVDYFIKDNKRFSGLCETMCDSKSNQIKSGLPEKLTAKSKEIVYILNDGDCFMCRAMIAFIFMVVTDNDTRETILDKVDVVCKFMGPVKDACYNLANEYIPLLLLRLSQSQSPLEICTKLAMCTNEINGEITYIQQTVLDTISNKQLGINMNSIKSLFKFSHSDTSKENRNQGYYSISDFKNNNMPLIDYNLCPMCKILLNMGKKYAINVTRDILDEDMNKLCNLLDNDPEYCVNLIKSYIDFVITILSDTNSNICKELQICDEE